MAVLVRSGHAFRSRRCGACWGRPASRSRSPATSCRWPARPLWPRCCSRCAPRRPAAVRTARTTHRPGGRRCRPTRPGRCCSPRSAGWTRPGCGVLGRVLRDEERRASVDAEHPLGRLPRPSDRLVRDALLWPTALSDPGRARRAGPNAPYGGPPDGPAAATVRADLVARRGRRARRAVAAVDAAPAWPCRLEAARPPRAVPSGRSADRDLDAVVALFEAWPRGTPSAANDAASSAFLDELQAQQIPADTLAERAVRGDGVRLLTAHRTKGLEWDVVVVVGRPGGQLARPPPPRFAAASRTGSPRRAGRAPDGGRAAARRGASAVLRRGHPGPAAARRHRGRLARGRRRTPVAVPGRARRAGGRGPGPARAAAVADRPGRRAAGRRRPTRTAAGPAARRRPSGWPRSRLVRATGRRRWSRPPTRPPGGACDDVERTTSPAVPASRSRCRLSGSSLDRARRLPAALVPRARGRTPRARGDRPRLRLGRARAGARRGAAARRPADLDALMVALVDSVWQQLAFEAPLAVDAAGAGQRSRRRSPGSLRWHGVSEPRVASWSAPSTSFEVELTVGGRAVRPARVDGPGRARRRRSGPRRRPQDRQDDAVRPADRRATSSSGSTSSPSAHGAVDAVDERRAAAAPSSSSCARRPRRAAQGPAAGAARGRRERLHLDRGGRAPRRSVRMVDRGVPADAEDQSASSAASVRLPGAGRGTAGGHVTAARPDRGPVAAGSVRPARAAASPTSSSTAATAPLEPGVVVAGAGSGKTTVMAARVVWLVALRAGAARPGAGAHVHQQGGGRAGPARALRALGLWPLGERIPASASPSTAPRAAAAGAGSAELARPPTRASRPSRPTTPTPGGCCASTACGSGSSRTRDCSPTRPASSSPTGCCAGPGGRSSGSTRRSRRWSATWSPSTAS